VLKLFSVFSATILFFGPSSLDRTKHLYIHTPIQIEIEQSSPAFIALKQLSQPVEASAEDSIEAAPQLALPLMSGYDNAPARPPATVLVARPEASLQNEQQIDFSSLNYQQKARLEMAQEAYGTLDKDWINSCISSSRGPQPSTR
jgi:hypothetical protein